MYRIGVDIGGTKLHVGLFTDDGALLCSRKHPIATISDLAATTAAIVAELAQTGGISIKDIGSCGIGIPGTVSEDGRSVLKTPNLPILHANIADELAAALGIPTSLVQDSRAAAWGEYCFGAGRGKRCVVCVTLGTGVGCGIVADGKILSGALGSAGEIGHIPAVPNGRPCGCGKCGCVEKYAAGGGLDRTASELLGVGRTAKDLFAAAVSGDGRCQTALTDAVEMLGNVLVSVINTISPDCLLFSGGLSEQTELYIRPLTEYIAAHCYSACALPVIQAAALGANAPLYGAAFIPIRPARNAILSASVMCADMLHMEQSLAELERAGIDWLHCDIMDNHFVPNLMLSAGMLRRFRAVTRLPFDYHIMAENPERILGTLDLREGDTVSVHYESTRHLQRVIAQIRETGARPCVALNPATPIEMLSEILPELDMVLLMTVNPGFAGQPLVPGGLDKIARLSALLKSRGLMHILIEVDGNCSFENAAAMRQAGADVLVAGTSSIFGRDTTVVAGTQRLRRLLEY